MTCKVTRSAAWLIASPLFPFLVAAYAAGPRRRDSARTKSAPSRRQAAGARPSKDVVDTAIAAGAFETLVKALVSAELDQTLKGDGPFTVFAPVDEAFDRLPEGALAELLEDKEKLAGILTYHVVPGRVPASALESYAALRTVQGEALEVDASMGVRVGSAYVIQPDIETSNGVIHAIDSVLLPE